MEHTNTTAQSLPNLFALRTHHRFIFPVLLTILYCSICTTSFAAPGDLKNGITLLGGTYWMKSDRMAAAIEAGSGRLVGLYNGQNKPLINESDDHYFVQVDPRDPKDPQPDEEWEASEQSDVVTQVTTNGQALTFVCKNQELPGIRIHKRYDFGSIGGEKRAFDKTIYATGDPARKTLLHLVTRARLDAEFRDDRCRYSIYYSRESPLSNVFWARDMTDPIEFILGGIVGTADRWTVARFCAMNTGSNQGLAHYWFKANGTCAKPLGYAEHPSTVMREGWDMSWFATFVKPLEHRDTQTATQRFHLFKRDRMKFHQEYVAMPEWQAVNNVSPVSPLNYLRRYEHAHLETRFDDSGYFYSRLRSKEYIGQYSMGHRDLWYPDHPAGDDAVLVQGEEPGSETYPAIKIKEALQAAKAARPRVISGWYDTPQHINIHSHTAATHPEWFLVNRNGERTPSGWSEHYRYANFGPGYAEWMFDRYRSEARYYGTQMIYSDWNAQGPIVDWANGIVRQTDDSVAFRNELCRLAHEYGGIYWVNCSGWDGMQDVSYWESIHDYDAWGGWRNFSELMQIRRIQTRPGQMMIPLYWSVDPATQRDNYEDYINTVLAYCMGTAQCGYNPTTIWNDENGEVDRDAMNSQWVAYYDTAFEMFRATWADVEIQPAWWRDDSTPIQAAAFKLGSAHILTVLNHGDRAHTVLTADTGAMGLNPGRPTFVWRHDPRDPIAYPKRAGEQPENWELLFTNYMSDNKNRDQRSCYILKPGSLRERVYVPVPDLVSERTRMITVTQVPAVFYSMEGQRLNLFLPETLGSTISGSLDPTGGRYQLQVSAVYPSEILVYRPDPRSAVRVNNVGVGPEVTNYSGPLFVKVSVPAGESVVTVGAR